MARARAEAAKQFSFRLPKSLMDRVERCMDHLQSAGMEVTRTDVIRILLRHALDATQCRIDLLFGKPRRRGARTTA